MKTSFGKRTKKTVGISPLPNTKSQWHGKGAPVLRQVPNFLHYSLRLKHFDPFFTHSGGEACRRGERCLGEGPLLSASANLPRTLLAGQDTGGVEAGFSLSVCVLCCCFWTNQIPSSTVSALSVQLWMTSPAGGRCVGSGYL